MRGEKERVRVNECYGMRIWDSTEQLRMNIEKRKKGRRKKEEKC